MSVGSWVEWVEPHSDGVGKVAVVVAGEVMACLYFMDPGKESALAGARRLVAEQLGTPAVRSL